MTAPAAAPVDEAGDALRRCLATLLVAAEAADVLGLSTDRARAVHADATGRLGFPSDAYVLALVGGTGVGKSSLLNALAGVDVSPASARRPTTSDPIAWVPATEVASLTPLLEWLDVRESREHHAPGLKSVAILDLPDMDSIEASHRERVEALLPRVDAVAWVTDLEKYHDAVLHDAFLRTWVPRLDRQAVIVNKADRLAKDDRSRIRRDLEADLGRRLLASDRPAVPVLMTTAIDEPEIDEFRTWLADGAAAKAVVRARVAATVVDVARELGRDAGLDPDGGARPFVDPSTRSKAIEDAIRATLRSIDLEGLERQAVAATRARARARGTGPIGQLTSIVYKLSGRETQVADPNGYLARWRDRAPVTPAVEALRVAVGGSLADATPAVRPKLAAALEPGELRAGLERGVGRAIAGLDRLEAPTSRVWSLFGLLQTLSTLAIAVSAAWVVIWILARPPVDSVELPLVGTAPIPFVALIGSILVGYVLARGLGIHAGWVGRRWARGVHDRVAASVRREVTERGLAPLDALEDARRRLSTALGTMLRECGRS